MLLEIKLWQMLIYKRIKKNKKNKAYTPNLHYSKTNISKYIVGLPRIFWSGGGRLGSTQLSWLELETIINHILITQ